MMDSAIWSDDWLVRLWLWCLFKANYRPSSWNGVDVKRGQFITGRNTASDSLHVAPSKWYRGMMRLQELKYISIEANSVWTRVTICNYDTYQDCDDSKRTAVEQPLNSEWTANEQPLNTRERIQEGKNSNREREPRTHEEAKPAEPAIDHQRAEAVARVAAWKMPTTASEPRHREALALWQLARKAKHGSYLPEGQWEAIAMQRAGWTADRWHEALVMSAADGTLNLATHQDDNRALSERNGNAKHRKARIIMDANEIPF